ncbi:MAG: phosphatase PAP2 family protein [Acidimicrobiales bacterium]
MSHDDTPPVQRQVRVALVVSAVAAASVALWYVVFVRTRWGQELDDLAFEGRHAVSTATTRRTDRMLHAVTESSLFLLGGAIVLLALAQRRVRAAVAAGACMSFAVVTTEVLKLRLLDRPSFGGVQGITHNSYPSGHATIGMVLSLGLVMVAAPSWRRPATVVAALVATAFGTAVLASGWHRPSDSLGAAGVALAWFAAGHAVLLWIDVRRPSLRGAADDGDRPLSRSLLVAAAVAVVAFVVYAAVRSIGAEGLHTVRYHAPYLLACAAIDVVGVAVVFVFAVLSAERARWRRDAQGLGDPVPVVAPPG